MKNSTQNHFLNLLQGYLAQNLTDTELDEFFDLLNRSENQSLLGDKFVQDLSDNHISGLTSKTQLIDAYEKLLPQLQTKPTIVRSMFLRRIAAASIILVLGVGTYFLFFNKNLQQDQNNIVQEQRFKNDVAAPKGTKAMITLANGQIVALDSINSGTLAIQGHVNVMKTSDGQIVYNGSSNEVTYNTLVNPRGSNVVNLTLQDGSKVWLNAESSLKYPVAFIGNDRRVEITGEAYFEITHDATRKFLVNANGVTTEVLGTHFNVNSYADEVETKVTLLEGSVKVSPPSSKGVYKILTPGQQAQTEKNSSSIRVIRDIDMNEVMAWKNGRFSFEGLDIESIMRQMARWYNVEIEYKDKITDKYTVKITRDVPASQVFKYIEMSGGVHFTIEGNKIIVTK